MIIAAHPARLNSLLRHVHMPAHIAVVDACEENTPPLNDAALASIHHLVWIGQNPPPALENISVKTLTPPLTIQALQAAIDQPLSDEPTPLLAGFHIQMSPPQLVDPTGVSHPLTSKEAATLRLLASHADGLHRDDLMRQLWPHWQTDTHTHTLDTHLYRLRVKLGAASKDTLGIDTQKGVWRCVEKGAAAHGR